MGSAISCYFQDSKPQEKMKILLLGLDAVGKTTILSKVSKSIKTEIPTIGMNIEIAENQHMRFTSWDLGGSERLKTLWRYYFPETQGLIFVVDSFDKERIEDAKSYLDYLLQQEELKDVPVLFLVNKTDLKSGIDIDEISKRFNLKDMKNQEFNIREICAIKNKGLGEALEWLRKCISEKEIKNLRGDVKI